MRAPRVTALLIVLLGGCPSPEKPEEAVADEALTPAVTEGSTPAARYTLGEVRVRETGGKARVTVELTARSVRPAAFDGLQTATRDVVLQQGEVRLLGGAEPVRMTEIPPVGTNPPDALVLPSTGSRRAAWSLAFDLPGPLPDDPRLQVVDDAGSVTFPLKGGWHTDDGRPAVAVEPVDLAGRALAARGELRWEGGADRPPPGGRPWLLPEGVDHAVLALDGFLPTDVVVEGGAPVVRPVVAGDAEADRCALEFAHAFDGLFEADGDHDPGDLAHRLGTPQAIAAWVREHVGVLGTAGLQRSPAAVLRLGAGGPVDRANLVIEMLRALGEPSEIVCGDLPPEVVRRLYAATVTVPPPPPALADRFAEGVPAVAALAGSLAGSLSGLPDRPLGAQHTYRLVPEWCWVELKALDKDTPPVRLDLRPSPFDATPLPFAWRSSDRLGTEVWTLDFQLTALIHTPQGLQNVVLAHQGAPVAALDERGVLIDLRPGHAPSTMVGSLTWFDGGDARAAVGEEAPSGDVEAVSLGLTWRDPSDIATRSTEIELWQRDDDQVPVLRVLVAPDPGVVDVSDLAAHLGAAVDGRSPVPGAQALAARHALYGRLRLGLSGGVITESPTMVATIASIGGDGRVGWRMEVLPPQPPVSMGGAADLVASAREAAADAVARALVLGVPLPAAPDVWLGGGAPGKELPPLPRTLQIAVMRSLSTLLVGASKATPPAIASVWMLDPVTGGVSWYQGIPTAFTRDLTPADLPAPGDPMWPFARWDLSLRCAEAVRWAAWAGRPVPTACR